jgi:hypothetical protein
VQEEDEKVPWCESRNPSSAESQRWLRRDRGVHSSESSESSEEVDVAAGPQEGPNPPATTGTTEASEATESAGEVDVAVGPWEGPNPPATSWMTEALDGDAG